MSESRSPLADESLVQFGSNGRLTNLPGLDGLRGLAVAVVVCFHGGWGWAKGGFLGVSLFFTLSGFLITSVLLSASSGSPSPVSVLAGFWVRRARRLLPIAWLTLATVVVAGWLWAPADMMRRLPVDILSSLANVANWRFLIAGRSYGELFGEPSPVLHYWSLAIEEQFYVLFPLALVGLLSVCRRARRPMAMALGVMATLSFALPLVLRWSVDRTYYGTDARAGELLLGAVLAVVLSSERRRHRMVHELTSRSVAVVAGTIAGAVSVVLWVVVDRRSSFVTGGGLALTALCSTALVLAAALPGGPVRRLVDVAPLRRLGHISYAVYLVHWPIMVFLSLEQPQWSRTVRFVVAVVASLVLGELSRVVIEQPIRLRRGVFGVDHLQPGRLAPIVVVAIIGGALVLDGGRSAVGGFDAAAAQEQLKALRTTTTTSATLAPGSDSDPVSVAAAVIERPKVVPSVAFFGDSISLSLALASGRWLYDSGEARSSLGEAEVGCGLARGGWRKYDGPERSPARCDAWPTVFAKALDSDHTDLAVVMSGQWELVDRRLPGDSVWRHIGDPRVDDYVRSEYLAATDVLASRGATVVWLSVPYFGAAGEGRTTADLGVSHDPARVDRINEIIEEVVAQRPGVAELVDLAGWTNERVDDTSIRVDGAHFNDDKLNPVGEWLGSQLTALWQRKQSSR